MSTVPAEQLQLFRMHMVQNIDCVYALLVFHLPDTKKALQATTQLLARAMAAITTASPVPPAGGPLVAAEGTDANSKSSHDSSAVALADHLDPRLPVTPETPQDDSDKHADQASASALSAASR